MHSVSDSVTGDLPADSAIREQLERILASPELATSDRRSAFLNYIVEETLAGRSDRLKGYTIAISVFGRDEDFDAEADPVVRLEARRLRRDLEHYYLTKGRDDPIVVTIPKGAYVPVFEHRPVADASAAASLSLTGAPGQDSKQPAASNSRIGLVATAVVVLLLLGIYVYQMSFTGQRNIPPTMTDNRWGSLPVIAVMPFISLSDSPSVTQVATGLTQDIITDLTRIQSIRVISYTSTSLLAAEGATLAELGRKLGATHVLSGSLQVMNNNFRLNANLVEVISEQQRWSGRFDYDSGQRFKTQTKIARQIAAALSINLGADQTSNIEKARFASQDLQVLYQQALTIVLPPSDPVRVEVSKALLQQFIDRFPDAAQGYGGLAFVESLSIWYGHSPNTDEAHGTLEQLASRALEIDQLNVRALIGLSVSAMIRGESDKSIEFARRAVEAQPSSSYANAYLGVALIFAERPLEALESVETAIQLDPANARSPYANIRAVAKYHAGDYQDSIAAFRKNIELQGPYGPTMMAYHAAAHHALGQDREERKVLERLKAAMSMLDPVKVEGWFRRASPREDYVKPLLQELEKAKQLD